MQYQRNKFEQNRNKENNESEQEERLYFDPLTNKVINPENITPEPSSENNENSANQVQQLQPIRTIIQTVRNDLKNKVDLSQLVKDAPIHSIAVKLSSRNHPDKKREKSPKTINVGSTREEIEYNIKTLNPRRSPKGYNQYQTGTSKHLGSGNDNRGYPKYFGPRVYMSKSPDNFQRTKDFRYFPNERRDGGGIIPFNQMSPNLNNNFEDMNSSGEKIDERNQINNYRSFVANPNQRNVSAQMKNRYDKKVYDTANNNFNNQDDINDKYKDRINGNMTYGDVKRIMRRFTKVYDPTKNSNGALIESNQIVVPGAADDVFTNRFRVLSKMNRLSNILLSKRKRSPYRYEDKNNLKTRNKSRSRSRSPLSINSQERAGSPMRKLPHNKFLYVSLAMLSSKGPTAEDRIILRKMRLEKGGVVDLAQEDKKKAKYKIKKISKNKGPTSYYHTNPKYREVAAKIIQHWWAGLKDICAIKLKQIVLIQSVFRGKWVRKNMYDLLYLNYLYICFCRKIEKVLSSHVRPLVFNKLLKKKEREDSLLKNIIIKKEKRDKIKAILPFWEKWSSITKNYKLRNKFGKQLVDIRSHKEKKLNILLAFFNKWRYFTKISNLAPGQNVNIYPLSKINGFCKIMDAAKKYIQKKALHKILVQLIDYLSVNLRNSLLKKIVVKKSEYEKNIIRNNLYYWYSKILNYQKASNEEEAIKLKEMRRKIFRVMVYNVKRRINMRYLRKYFIRFYRNTHPGTINKYILYEILRRINIEDLKEGEETIISIQGKKYKIIKSQKDLRIIRAEEEDSIHDEDEDKEQVVNDYEKIITKIRKEKKGKYEEGEEIPSSVKEELDVIDKRTKEKKKSKSIEEDEIPYKDIKKKRNY